MARDDRESHDRLEGDSDINYKLIFAIIVAILVLVFIGQNRDDAKTHFLFFTKTTKHWVSLAVSLIVGMILGFLARGALHRHD
jgi:uncharacterized integral membrane protein